MKKIIILLLLLTAFTLASAKKLSNFDKFLQKYDIKQTSLFGFKTKNKLIAFYPALSYTTKTSIMAGFGTQIESKKSSLSVFAIYTIKNQIMLKGFYESQFSNKLKYKVKGGIKVFPDEFYGVGNLLDENLYEQEYTDNNIECKIDLDYFLKDCLSVGTILDLAYNDINKIKAVDASINKSILNQKGLKAGSLIGLGASLKCDTRKNKKFPQNGIFWQNSAIFYPKQISDYYYQNYISDFRFYQKLPLGVWANRAMLTVNTGSNIPFYMLASSGGHHGLLGIKENLSKNKCAAIAISEWRVNLNSIFDFALIAGVGRADNKINNLSKGKFNSSIGGGLRYIIFKEKGIKMRFDIAKGSNGDINFTMGMGENF